MNLFVFFILSLFCISSTVWTAYVQNSLDGRIVGGEDISITKVPYQISLQYNGEHSCGGSIISPSFIVTAAHCTEGLNVGPMSIRAGTSTRESGGQVVNVSKIYSHPLYDIAMTDYDIAILELVADLIFGLNVAQIALPTRTQSWPAGTEVLVTGWGLLSQDSTTLPINLQGVTVELIDQESCLKAYGGPDVITDRMFCAGVNGGGKDSCSDDSGGPLQVDGILAGIVSFGAGCALAEYPGVYANVSVLRDFIQDVTGL